MIALPRHAAPCLSDGCGLVDAETLTARCATVRRFSAGGHPLDTPGCGALSIVDPHTGIRIMVSGQRNAAA